MKRLIALSLCLALLLSGLCLSAWAAEPLPEAEALADRDADGLTDAQEARYGTNPDYQDTDYDGLRDREELLDHGTDPLNPDSDGDGIPDGDELALGLDPLRPDELSKVEQSFPVSEMDQALLEGGEALPAITGFGDRLLRQALRVRLFDGEAVLQNPALVGKALRVTGSEDFELRISFAQARPGARIYRMDEMGRTVLLESRWADSQVSAALQCDGVYFLLDTGALGASLQAAAEAQRDPCVILLADLRQVRLSAPLVPNGTNDTDGDGLTDWEELCPPETNSASALLGADSPMAQSLSALTLYPYSSDPSLPDTDYDGIEDQYDVAPNNYVFDGSMVSGFEDDPVYYSMDYRAFFSSNTIYNYKLASAGIIFSAMIYEGASYSYDEPQRYSGGTISTSTSILQNLRLHGMKDTVDYKLSSRYNDDNITEIGIGHRSVSYAGMTKEIVTVVVRGTNGTVEEWSSNFDLGNLAEFFYSKNADWLHKFNHRGFDITATRVLYYLRDYVATYIPQDASVCYWLTGHSRGAAISNILAADLIDAGEKVFAYTYAAPNTTTRTDAGAAKYKCIWNIVNEDDFVPCVPMPQWGFVRYGMTAVQDMDDDMQNAWHDLTGNVWYNDMTKEHLDEYISSFASIASGWSTLYTYTCSCHGNGSDDDIIETGLSQSNIEHYSSRCLPYCKISSYTNWMGQTKYNCCQTPAFFLMAAADIITAENKVTAVIGYHFAKKYESVRTTFGKAIVAGIRDPHYCDTYYLITNYVARSDFQANASPSHSHSYSRTQTKAPTCVSKGAGYDRCTVCGDLVKVELPLAEHSYQPVSGTPATCTAEGSQLLRCSVCYAYKTETLPVNPDNHSGETELHNALAPSCTEAGFTGDLCCADCGAVLTVGETIPALGHSPAEAVKENELAPTETQEGRYDLVVYCGRCGGELSREHVTVPVLGPKDPILIGDLDIREVISLGSELIVTFRLVNDQAFQAYGFDSFYMEFIRHNLDGSVEGPLCYGEGQPEALVVNGNRSFDLKNSSIPAAEMAVGYELVFHGFVGDQEYVTAPMCGSLRDYFAGQLETIQPTDYHGAEKLRLAADTLLYGAKAQAVFNPDQGELLAGLSDLALERLNAYGSFTSPLAEDRSAYSDDGLTNPILRLSLQYRLEITVRYTDPGATGPVVVEFWPEGHEDAKQLVPASRKTNAWTAVIGDIGASGIRTLYRFRVLAGGKPVTNEALWSVESYAAANREQASASMAALYDAILNYGDAVNQAFD